MRDYSKVVPSFWTGETGKRIRKAGQNAQIVALYLMTAPGSNMLGWYYLPLPVLAHETGMTLEEASKALESLFEVGFAQYDHESEYVFLPRMAHYQIGSSLTVGKDGPDKRVVGIKKQLETLRKNPFFNQFLELYREAYHLHDVSPSEAPQKPLRCQDQDQDQDQDQRAVEQEQEQGSVQVVPTERPQQDKVPSISKTGPTWEAYAEAYVARYGADPIRNAKVNGILSQFVDRLPANKAPLVAAFYLSHNKPFYVSRRHPVNLLLQDAEGLHTEMVTGVKATTGEARNAERRDDAMEQIRRVQAMINTNGGA